MLGNRILAIAHRVCPALSQTAVGYSSKEEMVKATTNSLASAMGHFNGQVRLFVILDGCPEWRTIFEFEVAGCSNVQMSFTDTPAIGNFATYSKQVEILLAEKDADYLYFSEDDYLYRPDAFLAMADMLGRDGVDFVTPLDHPDRYNHAIAAPSPSTIRVTPYCHWRAVGTTCLTFMTSGQILKECAWALSSYWTGAADSTLWLGLTRENVRFLRKVIPPVFSHIMRQDRPFGYYLPLYAWKHHGLRLVTTRPYSLWQPMLTLAVHLSSTSFPPCAEDFLPAATRENIATISRAYLDL